MPLAKGQASRQQRACFAGLATASPACSWLRAAGAKCPALLATDSQAD